VLRGSATSSDKLWKAGFIRRGSARGYRLKRSRHCILPAANPGKAIVLRGSSISDFLTPRESGEYQLHHKATAGREGLLPVQEAIRRIVVAGRSSFFCPNCQRTPRSTKRRRRMKLFHGAVRLRGQRRCLTKGLNCPAKRNSSNPERRPSGEWMKKNRSHRCGRVDVVPAGWQGVDGARGE